MRRAPEPIDEVHVVTRDDHRHADVVEALEELHDLEREVGIEIAGRLVGDEQRRLADDGAGDADALLLAGRELERAAALLAEESHLVERRAHPLVDLAPRHARDDERQGDVVGDRPIEEQLVILEHDAEASAELRDAARLDGRGVLVIDEHLAARRALDERDQLQDAALARAGMAGEKHELARLDAKRHARERLAAVGVALVHLVEVDHAAPSSGGLEERGHELGGVENAEILGVLAHADEADGNAQPLCDGEHHAALGGAVELGDHEPRDAEPLVELRRLRHRVLADGAVQDQQHLVRCAGIQAREHALDLLELVHQMRLGMQPPGRIGDQHVDVPRPRRLQGIEYHRRRLRARLLGDDGHAIALRPDRQLLARRRPEGVARREHDAAALGEQPVRELADGGGLARAVDPHHQNDVGLDRRDRSMSGRSTGRQDVHHGLAQRGEQGIHIVELLARDPPAQLIENAPGRLHADIGGDEPRLEVVEDLGIDLAAREQFLDVGGEPRRPHVQLGAQSLEEAAHAGLVGFVRHNRKA